MYAELIGNYKNIGIKSLMDNKLKFIEFGTVHMAANPFMSRGYQASKDQTLEEIARVLQRGLGL